MLCKRSVHFIVSILVLLTVSLFSGCSNNGEKLHDPEPRILLANSPFVQDDDNLKYLLDAIQRKDDDYLQQLIIENKVFSVDKDTHVDNIGTMTGTDNELIIFKEGRYTNKKGVTLKNFLITEKAYKMAEEAYQAQINKEKEAERQRQLAKEQEIQQHRQEAMNIIATCFNEIENIKSAPTSGDIKSQQLEVYGVLSNNYYKLNELSNNVTYDKNTRQMISEAAEIIKCLRSEQYWGIKMTKSGSIDLKHIENANEEYAKAKQLRANFASKYGF